jgi:membrane-associated protease RseP (regulator of RpoE activity)
MGFRTDIKSSPPNSTSLFDFSFLGPFFGIISSLLFLVYGLQATISAGPEVVQFFPALTVAQLKMSTLGGGIVDYFLGGDGVITSQNPSSAILMHPFAVGGFVGLLIQSLEMLPLGSTDGGRISQALFGRSNHVLVGGWTWFALLLSTIFLDSGTDYIVGAWIINNVAQNDMEVPCREEVSRVDILRGFAAVSLWMVAILALVPMQ